MRVLITAGPTREPLDAVRYLSNRSSGTLGLALARAAHAAGHDTTLLLGSVSQDVSSLLPSVGQASRLSAGGTPVTPDSANGFSLRRFETVDDLQQLLEQHFPQHDVLLMAAAVGDFRLAGELPAKSERRDTLTLTLTATPDLVAEAAQSKRDDQTIVAFALEPAESLEAQAAEKLQRKGVDAIVANPLATMDAPDIDAVLLTAAGTCERPGKLPKPAFAAWLIERLPS